MTIQKTNINYSHLLEHLIKLIQSLINFDDSYLRKKKYVSTFFHSSLFHFMRAINIFHKQKEY